MLSSRELAKEDDSVRLFVISVIALLLAACSTATSPPGTPVAIAPGGTEMLANGPAGQPPDPNTVSVPDSCKLTPDGLPDRTCTPGLMNPSLTAAQLCAPGFTTSSIRPPVSYTGPLKLRLMAAYGLKGVSPADYELDHLVSLEDLGHPWAPGNLWPMKRAKSLPGGVATGIAFNISAEAKDQIETVTHKKICADQANAALYASQLASNWESLARQGIVPDASDVPKDPEP